MADISMQYSGIESAIREISQMDARFGDMITGVESLVGELEGAWEGKAQVEFALAYQNLKPRLDEIKVLLDDYSTVLSGMLENQQTLESISRDMMLNLIIKSE